KSGAELCLVAGRAFRPTSESPKLVVPYEVTGEHISFDSQASAKALEAEPDRMLHEQSFIADREGSFIDASGPKWAWIELMAKLVVKRLFVPDDKQTGFKPVLGISAQMGPS